MSEPLASTSRPLQALEPHASPAASNTPGGAAAGAELAGASALSFHFMDRPRTSASSTWWSSVTKVRPASRSSSTARKSCFAWSSMRATVYPRNHTETFIAMYAGCSSAGASIARMPWYVVPPVVHPSVLSTTRDWIAS
jgi:hypothetical protein